MDAASYVVTVNGQQPSALGALHTRATCLGKSMSVCCGMDCATFTENTGHHSVTAALHPLTADPK